jgi:lysozyme
MSWDEREKIELAQDEGRELKSYKDSRGNWTVGIGHYLGSDSKYSGLVITDDECDSMFAEDFENACQEANTAFDGFAGLDGPRKGALVNMSFQMGGKTVSTFHTFLNLLDLSKYNEAADDLLHTAYARQVPARAKRIAHRIRTGDYAPR